MTHLPISSPDPYPYSPSSINTQALTSFTSHLLLPQKKTPNFFTFLFLALQISLCFSSILQELANFQERRLEESSTRNIRVVRALYEALSSRDVETVHQLLDSDIEWWFHGPPIHQHMMRLLTGELPLDIDSSFVFIPLSITALGSSTVLVEGCDQKREVSWVHAWTVNEEHGIITQVREYFNTSLTVTHFGDSSSSSSSSSSSNQSTPSISSSSSKSSWAHCLPLWQSRISNSNGKSMPGLVLAI